MVTDKIVSTMMRLYPNENDDKILVYINLGVSLIREYLNMDMGDSDIIYKYENALILFLINTIDYSKDKGVITKKQGNKSITYANDRKVLSLTDDVKALLPVPRVRVMG